MKQNIYDHPEFFAGYKAMRDSNSGLNEVLEQPAIKSLLPELAGKSVLELGCGAGNFCQYMIDNGAQNVVGVDISSQMLNLAKTKIDDNRITFINSSVEDYDYCSNEFDLVVSSLAFHYVANLNELFIKIYSCLKSNGILVFSIEHPIATCSQGIHPGWQKDDSGKKKFWQVDEYSKEGIRQSQWIIDGVVKYHRQISSIINSLLENGFQLGHILEPHAIEEAERENPTLLEERRRPPFLIVKAKKENSFIKQQTTI